MFTWDVVHIYVLIWDCLICGVAAQVTDYYEYYEYNIHN